MTAGVPGVAPDQPFSRLAPAKVNLWLEVTGRRPDGYHELDSLVVFASWGDRLVWDPALPAGALLIDGTFAALIPANGNNLIARAHEGAAEIFGRPVEGGFRLSKELPVAAGIGGGSADAAAALRLLADLWEISADDPRWLPLCRRLGADVPVCFGGKPARMTGVGEKLELLPAAPAPFGLLLVNPRVPVETPPVFKARSGPFSPARPAPVWPEDAAGWLDLLKGRRNDLEAPAISLHPVIAGVLEGLRALPQVLLARMSGSGGTCFALFADPALASAAASQLTASHPHWWVAAGALQD
ncbi:4-(cytidine 5'-diphospho)-2-C-methyl-D-erythritol kinase [Radicibacter daui]|uniref:4-(cytidine 5'-diphospho)-2-C-methyl-D-erythritol kinase n=1 Tax=Radicibacter daui TaxID=3064829 RepID=UPI004046FB83